MNPNPTPNTNRGHVLVADDEPFIRDLVARVVRNAGFTVTVADNGLEAVERAQFETPDVVVIDVNMPRCDGPTAMAALNELPRRPEIVVISGNLEGENADAYLHASAYLAKPFDLDEIQAVVEAAAKRAQARRADAGHAPIKRRTPLRTRVAAAGFVVAGMLWGAEGVARVAEYLVPGSVTVSK